ncbi:MAG TPA: hypothetical protein VME66_09880 [Candidatus Acidoferrales bacterium]|nr:hypothetical protein [Candidatus Acidoferrales bacterium]
MPRTEVARAGACGVVGRAGALEEIVEVNDRRVDRCVCADLFHDTVANEDGDVRRWCSGWWSNVI